MRERSTLSHPAQFGWDRLREYHRVAFPSCEQPPSRKLDPNPAERHPVPLSPRRGGHVGLSARAAFACQPARRNSGSAAWWQLLGVGWSGRLGEAPARTVTRGFLELFVEALADGVAFISVLAFCFCCGPSLSRRCCR